MSFFYLRFPHVEVIEFTGEIVQMPLTDYWEAMKNPSLKKKCGCFH